MSRRSKAGVLTVLGVALLLLFGAMLPASAAPLSGSLIFRGVAQSSGICYPGLKTANPNTAATAACNPDAINNSGTRVWSLDIGTGTISPPLNSADFCAAADSSGNVGVVKYGVPGAAAGGACDLKGSGSVTAGPAYNPLGFNPPVKVGPYCGASHGTGTTTSTLGATSTTEQVEWIQSAASVLPTFDGDPFNTTFDYDTNGDGIPDTASKVLVAGVTDAIGAAGGGDCGATASSVGFNVIGVAVAIAQ